MICLMCFILEQAVAARRLWQRAAFGPPQLDLLMWKSTVLLGVNLKRSYLILRCNVIL